MEIWTERDLFYEAENGTLEKYTFEILTRLKHVHPEVIFYRQRKTWLARNFAGLQDLFWVGGFWKAYIVPFLPMGIDILTLKQSCMTLEVDTRGQRIGDIDIYLPNGEKVSRKHLNMANKP